MRYLYYIRILITSSAIFPHPFYLVFLVWTIFKHLKSCFLVYHLSKYYTKPSIFHFFNFKNHLGLNLIPEIRRFSLIDINKAFINMVLSLHLKGVISSENSLK